LLTRLVKIAHGGLTGVIRWPDSIISIWIESILGEIQTMGEEAGIWLLLIFRLSLVVFGECNSRFDLLQLMLNFRDIGLHYDAVLLRNIGSGFEPRDSSFQGSPIDHPPEKDRQRGSERCKEQQRINRSVGNSIA
jgi:hypothetical protein